MILQIYPLFKDSRRENEASLMFSLIISSHVIQVTRERDASLEVSVLTKKGPNLTVPEYRRGYELTIISLFFHLTRLQFT